MRLFITGISGLLGLNLALEGREYFEVGGAFFGHPVSMAGVEPVQLDITSLEAAEEALARFAPDVIVHTAALTNVDQCETDAPRAHLLNVTAAHNVAVIAANLGARLVHVSTDQLFDGTKPWTTETDTPAPTNNYGRTKWLAEQAVLGACPNALIVRTNFYGWGTSVRRSFSDWIIENLESRTELTMFSDVYFTPILINQLVDTIIKLIGRQASGLFHVAGSERVTKHDFALRLAEAFGYPSDRIRPISVDGFSFKARRPKEMSLNSGKAEGFLQIRMPTVVEGLERLRSLRGSGWPQELRNAIQDASPSH